MSQSQISATVSDTTRKKLDRFVRGHGLKKNFVIEQALLYYMEARRELPDEALLPGRLVLDDKTFKLVVDGLVSPPAPTEKLKELLSGRSD